MKALQPQRLRGFSHISKTIRYNEREPQMNHKLHGE